jgi:TonB family protein
VEIDCDARVLRRGGDTRTYGESLLTVAARASRPSLALAAFSESPLSLERRLIAMTERISTRSRATGALLVAGGLLLGAQACGVDSPMSQQSARGDGPTSSEIPVALREPTFTPFTVAPEITNRAAVIAAMEANYPRLLRDAGVGGTVRVYFLIAADGAVAEVRVDQSSGHPALDQAALAVAGVYRFRPALNGDEPVPVWVSFPITFQVR